jgi:hypothetical protein
MIKSKLMGLGTAPGKALVECGTMTAGLTATGSAITDALTMSQDDIQYFTTVGSSTGCKFGGTGYSTGDSVVIINHGASTLSVYPGSSTAKIANGSAGAAFSLAATVSAVFFCIDGTSWAATMPS